MKRESCSASSTWSRQWKWLLKNTTLQHLTPYSRWARPSTPRITSLTTGPGRRSNRDWMVRSVTSTRAPPSGTKRRPRLISKRQGTENASKMSFLGMVKQGGASRQACQEDSRTDPRSSRTVFEDLGPDLRRSEPILELLESDLRR